MVLPVLGEGDLSGSDAGRTLDLVRCIESTAVVRVEESHVDALLLVLSSVQVGCVAWSRRYVYT